MRGSLKPWPAVVPAASAARLVPPDPVRHASGLVRRASEEECEGRTRRKGRGMGRRARKSRSRRKRKANHGKRPTAR
ncbi:50S ribosomal protein bL37 [Streptosporangium roseum]|uniref:50S ribosomal protein bL37 n=1 Tax=Streptosporangium roseum TaxID=2001 RepID=UPI003D9DFED6